MHHASQPALNTKTASRTVRCDASAHGHSPASLPHRVPKGRRLRSSRATRRRRRSCPSPRRCTTTTSGSRTTPRGWSSQSDTSSEAFWATVLSPAVTNPRKRYNVANSARTSIRKDLEAVQLVSGAGRVLAQVRGFSVSCLASNPLLSNPSPRCSEVCGWCTANAETCFFPVVLDCS